MKGIIWSTGRRESGLRGLTACLWWGWFVPRSPSSERSCAPPSLSALPGGGPAAPPPAPSRGCCRPAGASAERGCRSPVPARAPAWVGAFTHRAESRREGWSSPRTQRAQGETPAQPVQIPPAQREGASAATHSRVETHNCCRAEREEGTRRLVPHASSPRAFSGQRRLRLEECRVTPAQQPSAWQSRWQGLRSVPSTPARALGRSWPSGYGSRCGWWSVRSALPSLALENRTVAVRGVRVSCWLARTVYRSDTAVRWTLG